MRRSFFVAIVLLRDSLPTILFFVELYSVGSTRLSLLCYMNTTTQPITYASYRRKSTDDERQVLSLDSQDAEIRRKFPNLKIVDLPPESVSAFKPYKRPVFQQMLDMVEAGKVQGIVAWHPDRLSRNPIDAGRIIYLLDIGKLKDLKFCSYGYENTAEGKMFLQFTMSQSKYSSDKLSGDVKRGINKKAHMGRRPTGVPLGYKNSKTYLKGEQDILTDEVRFPIVKQLWQYMLTGNYTVPRLLKIANEELHLTQPPTRKRPSERPIISSVLYNLFTNPFYYGWYEWRQGSGEEEWLQGTHQPMITEQEFDQVQKILGRAGKPRPKEHKFAFTGLMRCGYCGSMITAEQKIKRQQNGNVHHYVFYHCTKKKTISPKCPERSINLNDFNVQVDKILSGLQISDRFQKWALRYLNDIRKNEAEAQESSFEASQTELARVNKQLDSLLVKYTSPENESGELLADGEYKALKSSLLKRKSELEQDVNIQGRAKLEWLELSERTFNFARYAKTWFEKGDHDVRRAIFACLGSNLVLKDQKVSLTLRKPFKLIFEGLPQAEQELLRLEPLETTANIIQLRRLTEKIPVWSG